MYNKDFTYLIKSNIEKKRAFDRIGNVSSTIQEKDEKNSSYKFNTPRYTSMYLYTSINTPSYTTSTTNMYKMSLTWTRTSQRATGCFIKGRMLPTMVVAGVTVNFQHRKEKKKR